MKQDFSTILPQELWINILGRLPIRSLMRCKFVCKSWGDLIEGGDFESSIPKSCLVFGNQDIGFAVCDKACQPLFQFGLPQSNYHCIVVDSVKGLILAWNVNRDHHRFFICNPITCEYIELSPSPDEFNSSIFGFGVSKFKGQYKVLLGDYWRPRLVYTLERGGLWRSNIAEEETTIRLCHPGAFVNGNLHWLAYSKRNPLVYCFDLETELFTSFSLPPNNDYRWSRRLCSLEGLLCLCYISDDFHTCIWTMNNYGDENSWIKKYTFDQRRYIQDICGVLVLPLKVLANGDLLFTVRYDDRIFIYSKNTEALKACGLRQQAWRDCYCFNITNYTPSFLSLKRMGIHNVQSLNFH